MRDVARDAGVSPMTVSNALTGRRPVTDETRRRVLASVEALGYQINLAARSLRQGRTGVIGLAVPQLDSPYFSQLAALIARRLADEGLRLVVEQTGASREGELAALQSSRLRTYDGAIVSAVGLAPDDLVTLGGDLPVVLLGERPFDRLVDHVAMANVDGARAATRTLIDRGCTRLLALGVPPLDQLRRGVGGGVDAFDLRGQGFLAAVDAADGVTGDSRQPDGLTMPAGAAWARRAVHDGLRFDGLVCPTDTLALGVLRGLADAGVGVPEDVLVIGFDDVLESSYSTPSLSSVDPGHATMVEHAVRLLLRRIADPGAPPEEVVGPFRVVERESTTRPG